MYKVYVLFHNGVEFNEFFGGDYESEGTARAVQEALTYVLAKVSPTSKVEFLAPSVEVENAETLPAPTHPQTL